MADKYYETRHRWQQEKLDRLDLSMPKGQKAAIKVHAAKTGESMNSFILRAIWETIERDERSM